MTDVRAEEERRLGECLAAFRVLPEDQRTLPRNLLRCQPDRAAYDVRFGGRREAGQIAALFMRARRELTDITDGDYMAALADTLEQMDIQLYEHYRVLADLLLESARKSLGSRDPKAVYALIKGVRLGLLDPEKYLPPARAALNDMRTDDPFCALARAEEGRLNA